MKIFWYNLFLIASTQDHGRRLPNRNNIMVKGHYGALIYAVEIIYLKLPFVI